MRDLHVKSGVKTSTVTHNNVYRWSFSKLEVRRLYCNK